MTDKDKMIGLPLYWILANNKQIKELFPEHGKYHKENK